MSVATVVTFVECLWISEYLGWQIQERQRFDQGTFVTFKSYSLSPLAQENSRKQSYVKCYCIVDDHTPVV